MSYSLPPNPKVKIFDDILQLFIDNEENNESISPKFLSNHFQISIQDACVRVGKLRSWGMIKNVTQGRINSCYIVSDWGKKFMANRKARLLAEEAAKEDKQ